MEAPEGGCRTYEELAENKLGKANGNVFRLRPAEENTHDGVIMVRLKKKRFIVIDYSLGQYDPNNNNNSTAGLSDPNTKLTNPFITNNNNNNNLLSIHHHHTQHRSICITQNACTKVGIPNLVYDSEPTEPTSLYLRSGLCFTCQRNVNEKRRTQRKRKGAASVGVNRISSSNKKNKRISPQNMVHTMMMNMNSNPYSSSSSNNNTTGLSAAMMYGGGENMNMNMNASLLSYHGTAAGGGGGSGNDDVTTNNMTSNNPMMLLEHARMVLDDARQNVYLLSSLFNNTASTSTTSLKNDNDDVTCDNDDVTGSDDMACAVPIVLQQTDTVPSTSTAKADAAVMYEKAITNIQKSMQLLEQWKYHAVRYTSSGDDATTDSTAAQKPSSGALSSSNHDDMNVNVNVMADAVATAANVVAIQPSSSSTSIGHHNHTHTMVSDPLLLQQQQQQQHLSGGSSSNSMMLLLGAANVKHTNNSNNNSDDVNVNALPEDVVFHPDDDCDDEGDPATVACQSELYSV